MEGARGGSWPNERLDDLAGTVRALAPMATQIARLEVQNEGLAEDVNRLAKTVRENQDVCIGEIRDLRVDFDKRSRQARTAMLLFLGPIAAGVVTALGAVIASLVSS